jgi:DNA modification methylase
MIKLINGDCLDVLRRLPAGTVDAVITDPPYGMRYNVDGTRYTGGHRRKSDGTIARARRRWSKPVAGDDRPFDPSPWLNFARVVLWGGNHFAGRLPRGTTLVWIKRNEPAFGSFLSDAEIAWVKGGHGVYCHKDTSMYAVATARIHPCQKPVGLMRWCIRRLKLRPRSTILDPYMGSGTTGVAAVIEGFNFIGVEIDPEHFAVARERIRAAQRAARKKAKASA